MFLMSLLDHKVIATIVAVSIAAVSLVIILIQYLLRKKKLDKWKRVDPFNRLFDFSTYARYFIAVMKKRQGVISSVSFEIIMETSSWRLLIFWFWIRASFYEDVLYIDVSLKLSYAVAVVLLSYLIIKNSDYNSELHAKFISLLFCKNASECGEALKMRPLLVGGNRSTSKMNTHPMLRRRCC